MKKAFLSTAVFAGVTAAASPLSAYDIRISDKTYAVVNTYLWGAYTQGSDDEGFFGRGLVYGAINHTLDNGIMFGATVSGQGFTNLDQDFDNIGDGSKAEFYTGIGYATGDWGTLLYGETFGAVTELTDIAPSAIGVNYSVSSPFSIHTRRPRFAPRNPTASPDFLEPTRRFGYYTPAFDGFQLGMTYAPDLQDDGVPTFTNIQSKDAFDVSLVWLGQMRNVRIRATTGYQQAEADRQAINAATSADQSHVVFGTTLWWKNWTLGGNIAFAENIVGFKNIDNDSWQVGLKYTKNKYQFSVAHGKSTDLYSSNLIANPFLGGLGDPTMNMTELAASYQINKYAKLSVAGVHVEYDDKLTFPPFITTTVSNSGTYGVVQLFVKF